MRVALLTTVAAVLIAGGCAAPLATATDGSQSRVPVSTVTGPAATAPAQEPSGAQDSVAPPAEQASRGLMFTVAPADAEILIDGERIAPAGEASNGRFVPLSPGIYQVSIKRAGYATWRGEVAVRDGAEKLEITLLPRN